MTTSNPLAVTLFTELLMADQMARNRISKVLPKGMEISHFSVLNYLAQTNTPRTPAQIARTFNLTKGAITNTLGKLEIAGHIHISPDWDDARRKQVAISPAGRSARQAALDAIGPVIGEIADRIGEEKLRTAIPVLREIRLGLSEKD